MSSRSDGGTSVEAPLFSGNQRRSTVHVSASVVTTVVAPPRKGKEANCRSTSLWRAFSNTSLLHWQVRRSVAKAYPPCSNSNSGTFMRTRLPVSAARTSAPTLSDLPRFSAGNVRLRSACKSELYSTERFGLKEPGVFESRAERDCRAAAEIGHSTQWQRELNSTARLQPVRFSD